MSRNRVLRLIANRMIESLPSRLLLCAGHYDWTNFEKDFPTEAAILKGEIPAVVEETAAEGGTADIVWANRGLASDNFASVFGSNAAAARNVVDAVIRHYERVVTDFNQPGGGNTINVTISMDSSGTGLGGGAGSYVVSNGYMTGGAITIDRGNNGSGSGWYIDPQPDDFAEFNGVITNAFAVNAPAGSAANGLSDFYTIIMAEMTHVLGINSNSTTRFNAAATREWTDTNIADTAEGGGIGTFHVFQGNLINHLMTSNNGGSGGSDRNFPLHGAGPGVNVNFSGQTWVGAQDAMNAVYEGSRRYLVPETSRLIMQDAYAYGTVAAQTFGTGYAILNRTTGVLTVRGGDFHTGSPVTNDRIYVSAQGSQIYVAVDPPADIAGTWTQPGGGDFPAWTSQFNASEVNQIVIEASAGNDSIYIYGVPSGVTVVVNAGTGDDLIQIGDGDIDDFNTGIMGNVTVNAGTGTDTLHFYDFTDNVGADTYTVTSSTLSKTGSATVTYSTAVERIDVSANAFNNVFDVNSANSVTAYYLNGLGGDDTFRFDVDFDAVILGAVSCLGGAGNDRIVIDDSSDTGADSYLVTGNRFEKNSATGTVHASSTVESIDVTLNGAANAVNVPQLSPWLSATVRGGGGNDTLTAGNNNFDGNIPTSVTFDGGAGTDAIIITDGLGTGATYNFTNNRLDKGGAAFLAYTTAESFNLTLNALDNTFNLRSTHSQTPLTLNTGSGDDTVNVGGAGTFLFNFGSSPTINSSGGADLLAISDVGYAGAGNYTFVNGRVDLPFNGVSVHHSNFETLTLTASGGNNTINVDQNNITALISGGDGDDTINVGNGNFAANITATVLAVGGNGNDFVYYRDAGAAGDATYTITSGGVAKSTTSILLSTSFFGPTIDNVWIDAGGANHAFNVESLGSSSTPMNLIVSAGAGNDTMNVTPTAKDISSLYGNVTLNGDAGNDSIIMHDFNAAGGDVTTLAGGLTKNDWPHVINYNATATNESIRLDASNAASTIRMIGSPLGAAFRIDANGGADDIDIEGNALGTAVTVTTGAGLDTLRLNDDNSGVVGVDLIQSEDLGSLFISAGGLLTLTPGSNKALDVSGATIEGRIDLNDNYFIRRNNANYAFYAPRLAAGYNAGTWTTASQPAIFSSVAASAAKAYDALGMILAGAAGAASFGGVAVGANDLLIGYTQLGDTDLDRDVDFDDLLRLSQNYATAGTKYWFNGDYDYDGDVDFDDLLSLAQRYGQPFLTASSAPGSAGASTSSRRSVMSSLDDDRTADLVA